MINFFKKNKLGYLPMIIIFIISLVIYFYNDHIAVFFLFHTILLYGIVYGIISIVLDMKSDKELQPISVAIIMFALFVIPVPTLKFYIDLYHYCDGEVAIVEGSVTETKTPRGYLIVYVDDTPIEFWGLSARYTDFPDGNKTKISYLPRSRQGIDFEAIKE